MNEGLTVVNQLVGVTGFSCTVQMMVVTGFNHLVAQIHFCFTLVLKIPF